jgi:hypothetical protein
MSSWPAAPGYPGPGERDMPSWDELLGHARPVSRAEVRDEALRQMGEGDRVPGPGRPPRYVTDDQALAELHEALGTP